MARKRPAAPDSPKPIGTEAEPLSRQSLGHFPIVGIGVAAGGLEALTQLLKGLAPDTGMGFVLVQHVDPYHEGALTTLLSKASSLPVHEVTDHQPVEPNHVYVIPPNTTLTIAHGVLTLRPREQSRAPHRAIDAFFESLARDQRDYAIGVVLSGATTDGTVGLETIKAEGGITFAQDKSAKYGSMPESAVAAGVVDFVLSSEAIALELSRIAKRPNPDRSSDGARSFPVSALIASAQLAAIVESSDDAIVSKDLNGIIQTWNAGAERIFGFTPEEAVGRPITILIPPNRLDEETRVIEDIRRGQAIHYETIRRRKNGTEVPISLTVSPIYDSDGRVVGASKIARDISDRREAERALREHQEQLAAELSATQQLQRLSGLLTHGTDPGALYPIIVEAAATLMRSDMASMQVLDSKQGGLRLVASEGFGPEIGSLFAQARADGRTSFGVAAETGRRVVLRDIMAPESILSPEAVEVYRQAGIRAVQSTPLISRSGRLVGMLSTHCRVPHEPRERDLRLFDILARQAADLVDRHEAEVRLRTGAARYARLFEVARDGILALDGQTGKVLDVNPSMADLLELPRDQILGRELHDIGLLPSAEDSRDVISRLNQHGYVRFNDLTIQNQRGMEIHVEFISNVYHEDDRLVAQCNVRDITERVTMERRISQQTTYLADESHRKDQFLAMLSHELRNPLAPIRSAAHLLRLQEPPGNGNSVQTRAREIIERQVGTLTKMVDDLLEVSRVVTGRIRLDTSVIDLNSVVNHAVETVRPLIDQQRHTLTVACALETPLWIQADATRLEEVFVNLLNNAAKFTDQGGQVAVVCERERDRAVVRVRDTGVGIDPDLLPDIFDLFSQADRSLDRAAGGLGIGLSLAHRLIQLHGGTIEAHSEGPGAGSEFVVRLPLVQPAQNPEADLPIEAEPGRAFGWRVLVVDDNIDACTMLSELLRAEGNGVQVAHTGQDALSVASIWRPDAVLLDIGLPELDGYEVARRIRADPALDGMRLIAITGYGSIHDLEQADRAGFDAHLLKPIDAGDVQRLFREWQKRA